MPKHRIEIFSPEEEGPTDLFFFVGMFGLFMGLAVSIFFLLMLVPVAIFIIGGLTYDKSFTSSHRRAIAQYRRLDSLTQKNLGFNESDLAGMSENDADTVYYRLNGLIDAQKASKAAETKPIIKSIEQSIASEIERHDNIVAELTKE